ALRRGEARLDAAEEHFAADAAARGEALGDRVRQLVDRGVGEMGATKGVEERVLEHAVFVAAEQERSELIARRERDVRVHGGGAERAPVLDGLERDVAAAREEIADDGAAPAVVHAGVAERSERAVCAVCGERFERSRDEAALLLAV